MVRQEKPKTDAELRKFGFVMDDTREGLEFWPHSRMCHLELPKDGEQTRACDVAVRAAHDG